MLAIVLVVFIAGYLIGRSVEMYYTSEELAELYEEFMAINKRIGSSNE